MSDDLIKAQAARIEAQEARIERLDARIVELRAEATLWWDENFKKQFICEQMGKRITELEDKMRQIQAWHPTIATAPRRRIAEIRGIATAALGEEK